MVKNSTTMSWVAAAAVSLGASEAALKLILGQLAGVPLMLLYRALIAHRWEQKWVFQNHTSNQDNDDQCEGRRTSSTCSSSSLGSWLASGSSAEMLSTRCTRFVVVNITLLLT